MSTLVLRVPVISTGHIPSNETIESSELLFAPYYNGWFVYMGDELDDPEHTPIWYLDVWRWAKHPSRDYAWVCFDSDGDYIDELEKYEW